MSYSAEEAAYDDWLSEIHAEYKPEAIGEFIGERLQSYYLANPEVAFDAVSLLVEARELSTIRHPRAALALAAAAVEVAIKSVLIEPIVHGLVHSESLAGLVTELSLRHTQMDRFKGLLLQIVADQGGGDLRTYRRGGAKKPLWEEIQEVQNERNRVLHRGAGGADAAADQAIAVATSLLDVVFPDLLTVLGLHEHGNRVCNDSHARERMEAALALVRSTSNTDQRRR